MSVPNTMAGKAILVTGAGRGLGRALVDEALHRGADRVYAAARRPVDHPDPRVTSVRLDLTDPEQVRAAAELVGPLDVLVLRDWDIPQAEPAAVARAILSGLAAGREETFPDPMSASLATGWDDGVVKSLERANAAAVQAVAVAS